MAKATTNKDRRLASRNRDARPSLQADEALDDETLGDEELDPAGESMMEEEAEQLAEQQEAIDDGRPLPAAFATETGLSSAAERTAIRTYTVPAWTLGNPITRFIAESYIELRKVTWPTWGEAWNWTLVVVAMSAVVALILALADIGLSRLLTWLIGLSTGG